MKKQLVLIGGGGHCKSVIDVAEQAGYSILGILDIEENVGTKILNYTIMGTDDMISQYVKDALFIVTVGQLKSSDLRIKLHDKITQVGGKFATIISPKACVSKYATIGEGTVIMHNAVVNADAEIGKGCIINTFANIEHDARIGNYTHISTGAMINGQCQVGNSVFIGSQSVLAQCVSVADNSIVSAGSFVNKNINEPGIYAGNPMRKVK